VWTADSLWEELMPVLQKHEDEERARKAAAKAKETAKK
jgi:hypothetical protein